MSIKVQMLGAPELLSRFRALNAIVGTKYIDESLQAGAETVLDSIIRKAPEDTGTLKHSIHIRTISTQQGRVVKGIFIDQAAFYWRFLEFGKRLIGKAFIRQAYKNRRSTARQVIRDTFRDRILGFKD